MRIDLKSPLPNQHLKHLCCNPDAFSRAKDALKCSYERVCKKIRGCFILKCSCESFILKCSCERLVRIGVYWAIFPDPWARPARRGTDPVCGPPSHTHTFSRCWWGLVREAAHRATAARVRAVLPARLEPTSRRRRRGERAMLWCPVQRRNFVFSSPRHLW